MLLAGVDCSLSSSKARGAAAVEAEEAELAAAAAASVSSLDDAGAVSEPGSIACSTVASTVASATSASASSAPSTSAPSSSSNSSSSQPPLPTGGSGSSAGTSQVKSSQELSLAGSRLPVAVPSRLTAGCISSTLSASADPEGYAAYARR